VHRDGADDHPDHCPEEHQREQPEKRGRHAAPRTLTVRCRCRSLGRNTRLNAVLHGAIIGGHCFPGRLTVGSCGSAQGAPPTWPRACDRPLASRVCSARSAVRPSSRSREAEHPLHAVKASSPWPEAAPDDPRGSKWAEWHVLQRSRLRRRRPAGRGPRLGGSRRTAANCSRPAGRGPRARAITQGSTPANASEPSPASRWS
jgi:hypothetical protein